MVAVAVTTAPRPRRTLETALASLEHAGGPVPVVYEDSRPEGIVRTWRRAVEGLLVASDARFLMVMQDDVTWPDRGWETALTALHGLLDTVPSFGYASLHTMARVRGALAADHTVPLRDRWYRTDHLGPVLHKQRWCGAQCWIVPRASAWQLVRDPIFQALCETHTRSIDHLVTARFHDLALATYTWYPSLLSHALGEGNRAPRQRDVS